MSAWRSETVETSEKHSKLVIAKMAAAATALGWPGEIVDAARTQMESISEIHIQAIDHIMNAWEQQLKLPNPMTASPSAMLSQLKCGVFQADAALSREEGIQPGSAIWTARIVAVLLA
jgi:hypothetical protein